MKWHDHVQAYKDTPEAHREWVAHFTQRVNDTPWLKAHRDFVEQHVYGFGERAFHWMWKLLVDELPNPFSFLEIGVYKGQVPSLVRLCADKARKQADIYGLTMLSSFSGPKGEFPKFPETDYYDHIKNLHQHFKQEMPFLILGDSTDPQVIEAAEKHAPYDVVYVDGGHEYDIVFSDLQHYPEMVKVGGYLVVDDASCLLNMYQGAFAGIMQVSQAVYNTVEFDERFEHQLAVMHNRVWKRHA